jgi:hypothetical protein
MGSEQDAYNELSAYTLAHRDPAFIHQHVVDAFAAQRADRYRRPSSSPSRSLGCIYMWRRTKREGACSGFT